MATETKRVYDIQVNGTDSFNELKKAIEQLNEKLKTLNQTSQEYKDTLKQLAELQSQLADTMTTAKDVLDAFGETGSDVVESFLTGFVEGMQEAASATTEVNTSTIELDDSLTKEASSLKELKEQINTLKDRLVQLNVNSNEYKKTVELLVEKNQKLQNVLSSTKTEVSAVTGSYNALSQEMSALRKRWKETADEAERAKIGQRLAEINTELKKMDASIGNYQRNVGNYAGAMKQVFSDPKKEIRALRLELAQLEEGTDEYNETLMRLAAMTTTQRKLNEQLRYSSSDLGDMFGNLAGAARSVAGGFAAFNSLLGLMGNQNGDLQKAMLKTQQFMGLIQGLSQLENLKDKIKGLVDGIKGFASRFGLLNSDTKEFAENTKMASTEAERATGSLNAQAGAITNLDNVMVKLNSDEKLRSDNIRNEMSVLEAKIGILRQESLAYEEEYKAKTMSLDADIEEQTAIVNEITAKEEEISIIKIQLEEKKKLISEIEKESIERQKLSGEITDEVASLYSYIRVQKEDEEVTKENISILERNIAVNKAYLQALKEGEKTLGDDLPEVYRELRSEIEEKIKTEEEELAIQKQRQKTLNDEIVGAKKEIAIRQQQANKLKQLQTEKEKLYKLQYLSRAQNELETFEVKKLIAAQEAQAAGLQKLAMRYSIAAGGARLLTAAIKGVKAALVSTGIGLLFVAIGSAVSNLFDSLKESVTGAKALNAEMEKLSMHTKDIMDNLSFMKKIWDTFGYSDFKKQTKEIYNLKAALESAAYAMNEAIRRNAENAGELEKEWADINKQFLESFNDARLMVDKLLLEVEKADRQKGMTQLQIDLEETNQKFADAIELVKLLGKEGKMSVEEVDAYIQRLNKDLALQRQMLIDKASTATTATTSTTHTGKSEYEKQKEEADKLYKELVDANKREEQKLKEKYEKEKKLLEKFHKDTTLLTKKYYEDLDKLLTERQKIEYDKWVAHLNALLGLEEKNSIRFYEQEIETMKKIFSADFGADNESPFEQLFNIQILDEWGSKAISITDDIAESMKMMGLDPTNIDDIQTMIDKWAADKKAIEDAEKALKKLKSEMKFDELQSEADAIEGYLDAMLNTIDARYQVLETETARFFGKESGFYTGLSPAEMQEQFEERYQIIEQEIQRELDLWKNAMEDESLSAEERNRAIQKYNQTMVKQNTYAVQKEIDANNLLIKSFERVSNAISSMSSSLADILGSVSDMIMDTAQRQYEANEITAEAYEEQFNKAKGIQIAQATINTIAGAVGAFMGITRDTGGWGIAAAAIEAAAVLAAGFAQIAQIRNTKVDSNGGGGGGGDSTTFQLPSVMVPEPTRVQNTTNQDDIDQLKNALGDQKVYVVESDISAALGTSNKRQAEVTF